VRSGKFDLFRRWMISNTPADKRIMLLIIGYSFGALLEGTYVINLGNIPVA
jgi:L-lactate permease